MSSTEKQTDVQIPASPLSSCVARSELIDFSELQWYHLSLIFKTLTAWCWATFTLSRFCLQIKALSSLCVSRSAVSNSLQPDGLYPARLLCPWNSPGKILEWVVIPFSGGSSWPKDQTQICIAGIITENTLFKYTHTHTHTHIWLCWVLVVACRIFTCSMQTLNCSMWDLVPWLGIKPRPPALGAES